MRCANCPLYSSWDNEYDCGESCGLFGDAWESRFQYRDKDETVQGCYIEKAYIDKVDRELSDYYEKMGEAMGKELQERGKQ